MQPVLLVASGSAHCVSNLQLSSSIAQYSPCGHRYTHTRFHMFITLHTNIRKRGEFPVWVSTVMASSLWCFILKGHEVHTYTHVCPYECVCMCLSIVLDHCQHLHFKLCGGPSKATATYQMRKDEYRHERLRLPLSNRTHSAFCLKEITSESTTLFLRETKEPWHYYNSYFPH